MAIYIYEGFKISILAKRDLSNDRNLAIWSPNIPRKMTLQNCPGCWQGQRYWQHAQWFSGQGGGIRGAALHSRQEEEEEAWRGAGIRQ